MRTPTARLIAAATTALVAIGTSATAAVTSHTTTAPQHDVTDPAEAQRVDRVPVDELTWGDCKDLPAPQFQCGKLDVPLDYDKPDGDTYTLNIMKRAANNPEEKKGSLFLNPGGPGGSPAGIVSGAGFFLSPQLLDAFDVVGVDPRGIGGSDIADCFGGDMDAFDKVSNEVQKYSYVSSHLDSMKGAQANRKMAEACNTGGSTVLQHMSTAEVARDMDVVRRALGDDKLTYLGFSYGTYLGAMYGNLFPDRVRAVVNDGVINPADWAGTNRNNANMNQDNRLYSAIGAEKAMHEGIRLCEKAGPEKCRLAKQDGDDKTAPEKFEAILAALASGPLTVTLPGPDGPRETEVTMGKYANIILGALYGPDGPEAITGFSAILWDVLTKGDTPNDAPKATLERLAEAMHGTGSAQEAHDRAATYLGVACSDGRHPRTVEENARRAYDARYYAPVLGQVWAWGSVPCSPNVWENQDAGSYYGEFGKTTAAGMVFVGALWDPATAHEQAVTAAKAHPGSSFISVNNWGHTSYASSPCATVAIDNYLIDGTQPGTLTCTDATQPFTDLGPRTGKAERPAVVPFKPFSMVLNGQ